MELPGVEDTFLTERQKQVLVLREEGETQREIAEEFGTSASNVSMIQKAAEENIEKAHRTVELAKHIRTPQRVDVEPGDHIDDVIETVYDMGDVQGVKIEHSRPELYTHIYTSLSELFEGEHFDDEVGIGITEDGNVEFYR
jgi:Tfx family DNA-binding protein